MRFGLRPGVRRLFRHESRDAATIRAEADAELDAFMAERIDSLVARGLSLAEAEAEAHRRLGPDIDAVRHRLHHSADQREKRMRRHALLDAVRQDVRYALRGLARRPMFTIVAVLTLAIGIGATTAIFSALDALLLRPLPFGRPDELMKLVLVAPDMLRFTGSNEMVWSYPKYAAFRDTQQSFAHLALYQELQYVLTAGDVQLLRGESVGATYLRTLGLVPVIGRDLSPSLDAQPGAAREILVSHALWQQQFRGDSAAIGQTLELDHVPYTIVGITAPGFKGLSGQAQLFVPVTARPARQLSDARSHEFNIVARRKGNVSAVQAAIETAMLGTRINATFGGPALPADAWSAQALPLDGIRVAPLVRRSVLVLFGAVLFVLLIACVNVANLLVGRANGRQREIAIRLAIGAGRGRLVRLFMCESLVLAFLGGAAGVVVASTGARALSVVNPLMTLGRRQADGLGAVSFSSIALDWRALAFTVGLSSVAGLVFGLVPACGATRASLADSLKSSAGSTEDRRRAVLGGRRALVVLEVAMAMVLLAGAGLMTRSLAKLLATDYGFVDDHVLTLRLTALPGGTVRDSLPTAWNLVLDRLAALPGVVHVGLSDCAPLSGGCRTAVLKSKDGVATDIAQSPVIGFHVANAEWFAALHVPIRAGRLFSSSDRLDGPPVVVINETAARTFFPHENAVGHTLGTRGGLVGAAAIVGVVGDVRQAPDSAAGPEVYVPLTQSPRQRLLLFLETSTDPRVLVAPVRRAIKEAAPHFPIDEVQTMSARTADATAKARFSALLLVLFATTALSLAVIGLYGVMSLGVAARTREIGIRIALGADRHRVQRLVVAEGMALVALGTILGLGAAMVCTQVLRSALYDMTPTDPVTYAGISALLAVTAAIASWVPARRASRIDPINALRTD